MTYNYKYSALYEAHIVDIEVHYSVEGSDTVLEQYSYHHCRTPARTRLHVYIENDDRCHVNMLPVVAIQPNL